MSVERWRIGSVVVAALLGAACTTMGTGVGEQAGGGPEVRFNWTAQDAVKGEMTATFPNGTSYSGTLFQITSDTRVDDMAPLWVGWRRGWFGGRNGWSNWDAGPEFVKHYSGRVLANLSNANGDHMRCNFRLIRPASGMAGGGQGQCQLPDGHSVDATFAAA